MFVQDSPVEQDPQLTVRELPQLSAAVFAPHDAPTRLQNAAFDSGVQTHWLFVHTDPALQEPQLRVFPHAFETPPHCLP